VSVSAAVTTRGERGSATVELAVALPVVAVVAVLVLTAVVGASVVVRMHGGAAAVARAVGRDDLDAADAVRAAMLGGMGTSVARSDGVVCVTADTVLGVGAVGVPVRATGCAPDGGR
jgi:hypothetical protein